MRAVSVPARRPSGRRATGSRARRPGPASNPLAAARRPVRRRAWDRPLTAYYLILGGSLLITVLGLVMVFSASQIQALQVRPARPRTSSASSCSPP